ncbi:MAG: glycosyltransferase [Chloroflexi bacterium]|nr:glycosyltransferase [Chloroflexota bacterium]
MKILLLTPDLPYPSESGAAIRNIGLIRGLARARRRVTLLSFTEQTVDAETNPLYQLCERVESVGLPRRGIGRRLAMLLLSGRADIESRLASRAFDRKLGDLLGAHEFDLVQFSGIELGHYLPSIRAKARSAKIIYDALNAEAELQRLVAQVERRDRRRLPAAIYSTIQSRRLARYEGAICRKVDAVLAVSDEDRRLLERYGGAPIHVLPNGVAAADYAPPAESTRAPAQLVFSGKMDYRPNVDAVEWFNAAVFPRIRQRYPEASLLIAGRNPQERIQALASDSRITVTGWVDSIQPYLHKASIYIVPLRMGSGTRLKILQAMAARCAVVSTSVGAAGLKDEARAALCIADGAEAFAEAVSALLADEERRRELGARAERVAKEYYDWSALTPRLLRVYAEMGLG